MAVGANGLGLQSRLIGGLRVLLPDQKRLSVAFNDGNLGTRP